MGAKFTFKHEKGANINAHMSRDGDQVARNLETSRMIPRSTYLFAIVTDILLEIGSKMFDILKLAEA